MAWWHFGRKRRKVDTPDALVPTATPQEKHHDSRATPVEGRRHDTPMSSRRQGSDQTQSIEKVASNRTPVITPRSDVQRQGSAEDITALPITALPTTNQRPQSPRLRQIHEHDFARPSEPNTPLRFAKLPSLRSKKSGSNFGTPKRTMSRRRPDDHVREGQIRAMTASPVVTGRSGAAPGDVARRHSKRSRDDVRKGLRSSHSNVSLHTADSVQSSYTVPRDRRRWDLGAVDALSPRPTIRHSFQQPINSSAIGPNLMLASNSVLGSRPVTREDIEDHETIAQLADNLDSGTIRQLMERDQRRREKRRMLEEDRARRRLERHAAKRAGETSPLSRKRTRSRTKLSQGSTNADSIGLALSNEAGPSQPFRYHNAQTTKHPLPTRAVEPLANPFADQPVQHSHRPATPLAPSREGISQVLSASAALIPIIFKNPVGQAIPTTEAAALNATPDSLRSQPRQSGSKPYATANDVYERGASERRTSGANVRPSGPLAYLFGRNRAGSRSVAPEPSFANTSRDSITKQQIPQHLRDSPLSPRPLSGQTSRSGTKSKFREDLPESPASLPDARLYSPLDSRTYLPELPESATFSPRQLEKMPEGTGPLPRDIPSREGPRKDVLDTMAPPPVMFVSHSLASVDSEGSWLSGKPPKRPSLSDSARNGSINNRSEVNNGSYENLGVTDEEYFKKLNPPRETSSSHANRIRTALADSDDDASPNVEDSRAASGAQIVQGDVARAPTVVHRYVRVQSNQGIFNEFGDELPSSPIMGNEDSDGDDGSSAAASSPNLTESSPATDHTSGINFGVFGIQHARQGSRGSARLLSIPARKDSVRSSLVVADTPSRLSNRSSAVMLDAMNSETSDRSSVDGARFGQVDKDDVHHPHNLTVTRA